MHKALQDGLFYVFESTSVHRRCFHQLKQPSTIRPQTFCPSIKNPLVLWYFPMGKASPGQGFCDLVKLAIIQEKIYPNLATY